MKRCSHFVQGFVLAVIICLQGPACAGELFQVSSFAAFEQGQYDGSVTFKELKEHGDLGIGTVNGLDGEMIALDDKFFQIRTDGKVYPIGDTEHTPFAVVVSFKPEKKSSIADIGDVKTLHQSLDRILPDLAGIYAFRIEGNFERLKVRSVPKQEKPYPTLETVIKSQTVFELSNVKATLVGFRFPEYMKGVNVPGYHFHCITADKTAGGHFLDCDIRHAEVGIEAVTSFSMRLIPN
ncbi:MAG: acetolactate decarboxylase [Desulfomonile sp.]|nr:acetolactate decarboxylase [Desulfomonile sp.]